MKSADRLPISETRFDAPFALRVLPVPGARPVCHHLPSISPAPGGLAPSGTRVGSRRRCIGMRLVSLAARQHGPHDARRFGGLATATTSLGRRLIIAVSQGEAFAGASRARLSTANWPITSKVRSSRLPALLMAPMRTLSPLEFWRGVRPSEVASSAEPGHVAGQRDRARRHGADARNLHQPATRLVGRRQTLEPRVKGRDARVRRLDHVGQFGQRLVSKFRQWRVPSPAPAQPAAPRPPVQAAPQRRTRSDARATR